MPTPASGAISMDDMRTNINRATSSSISMSEMRDRYGGSGAISFSDLRNCEGWTINPVRYNTGGKFATDNDGWWDDVMGSVSPDENSGRVQFAANSFLWRMYENVTYSAGSTFIDIDSSNIGSSQNGTLVTSGYRISNVTRIVVANTSYSWSSYVDDSSGSYGVIAYNMPTSGTIHCLIKF